MKRGQTYLCSICLSLLLLNNNAYAYSPYTTSELDQLEKEFVELINESNSVIRLPLAQQYINDLSRRLALHSQIKAPYFFIVNSNEINAFAGPGGHIGINSELILVTESESELAAVMAHEMSHVRQHHLYRMLEHQSQMRIPMLAAMLASLALGVINPTLGGASMVAAFSGFTQETINFVRSNEKEADRIGIDMLAKSGLDPHGMATFFNKMQQATRYYYTANIPAILRTHPLDEDRIAEALNRITKISPTSITQNSDYYLFKELIRNTVGDNPKQILEYYQSRCARDTSEACVYGYALALLNANQNSAALHKLKPLSAQYPNNMFYSIALSEAYQGTKDFNTANATLKHFAENYPDNYATQLAYGQSLINAGLYDDAVTIFLKASRQFKNDLSVCELFARANAYAKHADYAYFVEAQCELLKGHKKNALKRLKAALNLNKKDKLLKARITAKIDEVKYLLER